MSHKVEKTFTGIEGYTEPPFPGFVEFKCDLNRVDDMLQIRHEVLANVRGVYLLVCEETGKRYVGAAKGVTTYGVGFSTMQRMGTEERGIESTRPWV